MAIIFLDFNYHLDLMVFAFNNELDLFVNSCHFTFFFDTEFLELRGETENLVISGLQLGLELAGILTGG
jgi:hypothetical protein